MGTRELRLSQAAEAEEEDEVTDVPMPDDPEAVVGVGVDLSDDPRRIGEALALATPAGLVAPVASCLRRCE